MRADKTEAKLKALLKQADNRRCVNCDSLGPQYVVCGFNVFVCTVCSGVHRQFGHRVKGVSMSTFKPEEVAALEAAGNGKFSAYFLSKWTNGALPKPVDRDVHRVHSWIAAVYQDRRFYAEPPGGWTPGTAAVSTAGSSTSEGREVAVRPLSDVLGSDTPKLKVQGSGNLERSVSAVSSSTGGATPSRSVTAASATSVAAPALNLLDVSSPKSAHSAPAPAAAPAGAGGWDPFGSSTAATSSSPAAAAAAAAGKSSPRAASAPAGEAVWASFGDAPAQQATPAAAAAPKEASPPAAAKAPAADSAGGWEAFGDEAAAAVAEPAAAAAPAPAATAAGGTAGSSPAKAQAKQPARSSSRPEVPMDVFFPEFEQIRATGILPTGQPVPLPAFPPSYGAAAGMPGRPQTASGANPYATYSYPAAAPRPAYGGAYGAAAPGMRPTIAIPPAPQHPGYGYGGISPAAYPGMPSPGFSASSASGYSPAGSMVSPAGSGFSSAPPTANGNGYGSFTAGDPAVALRGSTGSLSDLMPGSAAPTPAAHRLGESDPNDPFASLAPGLRGALPAVANGSSSKYGAAAPPPTPAGMPPFHPAAPAPAAAPYATAPFAAPQAPAAGLPPATAAATATLFGRTPSITGYDMSAPAAPKPQPSGNPFA